jgi:radical SAM protein (TIGR01212 family)
LKKSVEGPLMGTTQIPGGSARATQRPGEPRFRPSARDPIHWVSKDLKARFGGPVSKAALEGGITCPNRDGTVGTGGCLWCDPTGSGTDDAVPGEGCKARLERLAAGAMFRGRRGVIAYFQSFTSTHGLDGPALDARLRQALGVPGVVGVALGTRPDCLGESHLEALSRLNGETFLWVELGMQTAHDSTLRAMNRGHLHEATVGAAAALRGRGIRTVLHLILGLPGETPEMIQGTFREVARLRPWGVKFHPLHVVSGSPMEPLWRRGEIPLLSRGGFASLVADGLEVLPPEVTVHRLTGERAEGVLLAPAWCRDKRRALGAIASELQRRGTWQGHLAGP